MKLDTNDRIISVPHCHNFVNLTVGRLSPSGCFKAVREGIFFHDKRVIARCDERILEPRKNVTAFVLNQRSLAMHDLIRVNDSATKSLADALMTKADAEHGGFATKALNHIN